MTDTLCNCEHIENAEISLMDLSVGSARITCKMKNGLFFKILEEQTGISVDNEQNLLTCMKELSEIRREYSRIKSALDEVQTTGYGIVMPTIDQLTLEEPEIVKQGGRYGVRLCASAPSIHMMRADIKTEVAPIVGSESQSEELVKYLLEGFEEDPLKIWESNIFGKSLNELVNEGLRNKLYHMPTDARMKFQETLERVINEGCNGLLCIIL
jgi:stage IV sporulation protein A